MTMLRPLTLYQWGKESTRGTAVAATSKMAVEAIEFTPLDEMYRPNLAKGYLLPHSADETPIMRGSKFKVPPQPVIYNQHQHWCDMAIVGAVAAVGASDPYTWTFTRNILADPAPDTWTLERRLSDGTNFADNEWAYAFLTQIQWMFEENKALMFSAEGVARRVQSSTLTAALSMPTINITPTALAKVWLDSTWANLGTTQLTSVVKKALLTFKTGLKPDFTLDGRTDLDFTGYIIDADEVGLELELTVRLTKAQYDAQKAAAEAATLRAIRILVDNASANRSIQFDMLVKFDAASFFEVGDADGQVEGVFKFVESTDGTNFFKVIVENGVNVYT